MRAVFAFSAAIATIVLALVSLGHAQRDVARPDGVLACGDESSLRSINSGQTTEVTFINRSDGIRSVIWIDYSGAPQHYNDLDPGESYTQSTYVGHPWMITDSAGDCLGIYMPPAGGSVFEIAEDGEFPPLPTSVTVATTAEERSRELISGETCESRSAIIERMGGENSVEVATASIVVGETVTVRWTRGRFPEREPIYLMLSFDRPVRFTGEALYGLLPDAGAAFDIGWERERTRTVIPFFGLGVPSEGVIDVRPLLAEPLTIRWAVVGYDGCVEHVATRGSGEARIDVRTSGAPEIVVNDPFALGTPETVLVSPDGTRHIAIYDGRYRLLDAATGAEIAERAGTEPRFWPTGRFVAARGNNAGATGEDDFEALDAIDGAVVTVTSGIGLAWDSADSMLVVVRGGAGMIAAHDLLAVREIPVATWMNCRICEGFGNAGFYADLENNVAIVIGPQGGRAATLSTHRTTEEFRWDAGVQHFRNEIASFITATSAVIPVIVPSAWQFRTELQFTHIWTSQNPEVQKHLLSPVTRDAAIALADSDAAKATELVALNWRGLSRPSIDPCDDGGRGPSRVEECLTDVATTPAQVPLPLCDDQRGVERLDQPCIDAVAMAEAQSALINRLESIGLRLLAPSTVERWSVPEGDPQFIDTMFDTWAEEAQRLHDEINERISAETGMPSDLFIDRLNLGVSECYPSGEGEALKQFDVAWRWTHDELIFWLTTHQCFAGSAAFMYPSTKLYGPAVEDGQIVLGDLTNPAINCGNCCDSSLDACGFEARPFGSKLLIDSTKAGGFGVIDTNTGAVLVKQFGLPRADLFENVLLTEDGGHVVALNADGSFSVVRVADGQAVLEGRYADDEVVVWTPDRRFDATSEGAHFVSFRFPGRIGEYTFQQFEEQLRVPGLVGQVLSGAYQPAPVELAPPPSLSATIAARDGDAQSSGSGTLDLAGEAVGETALAGLQIYQDGLLTQRLGVPADATAAEWTQPVERLPGARWVSLVATDTNGVASLPMGRDLGPDPRGKRQVHVLAVGVDRYADARIPPLSVAEADARTFSGAIASAAAAEGSDLAVDSETLLLGDAASPAQILSEIERLATDSKRGETVAIFFAGHGVQASDGAYYLATAGTNVDDFPGTAVAWTSVAEIVARASTRVAIFLDSCHSGMAGSSYFATNDDAAESILDRVPSGVVIFSASKGRELAGEDSSLGGGFFTRALESAIAMERIQTDRDGNGAIEISELFGAVKRFVVEETDGNQTPWFARNQMVGDFALF